MCPHFLEVALAKSRPGERARAKIHVRESATSNRLTQNGTKITVDLIDARMFHRPCSLSVPDASDARVENPAPGNCTRWRLVGGRAGGIKERGSKKGGRKSSEAAGWCAMKRRGRAALASHGGRRGGMWNLKDAAGRSGRENLAERAMGSRTRKREREREREREDVKKVQGNRINKQINLCYVLDAGRGRVTGARARRKRERNGPGQKRENTGCWTLDRSGVGGEGSRRGGNLIL